jgi:hypothetical protein
MALDNIRQVVRSAGGASPEELFSTETENRKKPTLTDQEAADQAARDQEADEAARDQGYSYSPPQQQQAQSATYTNEDFYPGPADPAQFAFREGLQVVARPGRMPMGAITKAAASIERKRQQTNQAKDEIADLINRRVNIKDDNRQQAFNTYSSGVINKQVAAFADEEIQAAKQAEADKIQKKVDKIKKIEGKSRLIDKIGLGEVFDQEKKKKRMLLDAEKRTGQLAGMEDAFFKDENKVNKLYAEIANSPRKRGILLEKMRQLEAYGRVMDKNYEEAKKYFEDYNTSSKEFVRDENLLDRAKRILNPDFYGTKDGEIVYEGEIEDLLTDSTAYHRAVTLNDYFQRQIMQPAVQAGFATFTEDPVSGAGYWQVTDTKDWTEFKEAQIIELANRAPEALEDYMKVLGDSNVRTLKEAAKHYLDRMLPSKTETKVITKPTRSGGEGDNKSEYSVGNVADTETIIPDAAQAYGMTPMQGATMSILAVPLSMTTGGKAVTPEPLNFQKGNQNVTMIPLRVEMNKATGKAFVVGLDANDETVKSIMEREGGIGPIRMEASGITITTAGSDGTVTTRKIESRPIVYAPIAGGGPDANYNLVLLGDNWAGTEALLRENMEVPNAVSGLPVR